MLAILEEETTLSTDVLGIINDYQNNLLDDLDIFDMEFSDPYISISVYTNWRDDDPYMPKCLSLRIAEYLKHGKLHTDDRCLLTETLFEDMQEDNLDEGDNLLQVDGLMKTVTKFYKGPTYNIKIDDIIYKVPEQFFIDWMGVIYNIYK